MKLPARVQVSWRDAAHHMNEYALAGTGLIDLVEVGWLVKVTPEEITLTLEVPKPTEVPEDVRLWLTIPRVNVREIRTLILGKVATL